ncbi:LysR substrate-binding domain-containing protein [Paracoccus lutimaris]|uniref:DNA-binding transcriptional LysR family regulator n=1 Tax=Paracoccus lutimaris TaxID=1490030 RepID=A0A368YG95_9RHOB|nr:LysR substrate-binding domain-containing protein [Paracoccus lutimaris]RCW79260.1 DNA-binding transcriptional LysR family regulator [Paracoccus lutimaris]
MTALRVIRAIAERGSTTAAAESMHMSQSAVSKQLLTVEALLGVQIFLRRPTGMVPTQIGEIYIEQALVAIKAMEDAAFRVARLQSDPHMLRLKVLPIFGDRWLLPRFEDFSRQHPEIEVQYTTFAADSPAEQPDGVFRFGRGPFPNEDMLYLFGRDVRLVCTPDYLAGLGACQTLDDLAQGTVFEHPGTPLHWADLIAAHGRQDLPARKIVQFDYYTLVLRAAISGQGLALVPFQLIETELGAGQLVNPGAISYASDIGYWFTIPADRKPSAALRVFRDWLGGQI